MMTSQPDTTRRCLISSASLMVMLGCGAWLTVAAAPAHPTNASTSLLRLAATPQAAWIGNAVLAQLPQKAMPELVHSIVARISGFLDGKAVESCDFETLHFGFQQAVQSDFAQGRCLSVGGWVLARSEVELCALAALAEHGANG